MTEITLSHCEDACSLGRQSALAEARGLLPLLLSGSTIEELRELIAVPPKIECVLLSFARAHPEEAHAVEKNLKFRVAVARAFEKLLCGGVQVADVPEVEESEPGVAEEAIADPQT